MIVGLVFLTQRVLNLSAIEGSSMAPTLVTQERVVGLRQQKVKRFDIVIFDAPDEKGKQYVKRVIGLPGETVHYQEGQLMIDGQKVVEPYLASTSMEEAGASIDHYQVPEDAYFVMGDNREVSKDSRMFGAISRESIIGQVSYIYWPPNKISAVKSYEMKASHDESLVIQ
ncbi:signal peptidase I [Enterococcus canis]|uniref:Signal peptidase I n=1 Tax=Enterococcus canis TaxID=214095 RepID=A0A1L8RI67_9ENTE|nr:signal peptidase I [Enterococcus canis]